MKRSPSTPAFLLSVVVCILGQPQTGFCAATKIVPGFRDFLSLKVPYDPVISPDGRFILYLVRQTSWERNEYQTQLWVADAVQGTSHQLTFADQSSYDAKWFPNGEYISFLSARDGEPQVRLMARTGGESRAVTASKTGIGGYEWSPDGQDIAYVAGADKNERDKELEDQYGSFEVVDQGFRVNHLWLLNVQTGKATELVDRKDLNVGEISWSPDGRLIAFSATPDPRPDSSSKSDIYLVDIDSREVRTLVGRLGPDNHPTWSPDGRSVAFVSSPGDESFSATVRIFRISADGGMDSCLTEKFDEDTSIVAWKNTGIFFSAYRGMTRHLFLLDPVRKTIRQVTRGDDFDLEGVSVSSDGAEMGLLYQDSNKIKELYASRTDAFQPKVLTDFSQQIQDWQASRKETIRWRSADGTEITGVLSKPADFDAHKKYPLFVFIHGGPEDVAILYRLDPWNRYYPLLQLVAKGAVILQPNYRGSAGFGEYFRRLNYRNLGMGSYQDILSGVDLLISQGFVDRNRVAAMGWSQGGYISAFIACFSDRFRAVSAGGVTADWRTYYSTSDLPVSTHYYLGASPWDDPEIYRKTSPISYIDKAQTPTLIQNGELDQRVPVANALELYRALKSKGVPTKLIIYKGCGHGIPRPKENLAVITHNWHWFEEYIWSE